MRPPERDGATLITGSGSGIGAASAELLAGRGERLVLADLHADTLEAVADRCREAGSPGVQVEVVDVTDASRVEAAVAAGVEAFGAVDRLVTSAGIDRGAPAHEMTEENWDQVVDINLKGTFLAIRAVLARLIEEEKPGSIVCVSSIAAQVGLDEAAAYCASKGGVSAMVRALAIEYAAHGVRINAIAPGATETPLMWANVGDDELQEVRGVVDDVVPMGRLAKPVEQAQVVAWLLSDEASYVTGSVLVSDGGVVSASVLPA